VIGTDPGAAQTGFVVLDMSGPPRLLAIGVLLSGAEADHLARLIAEHGPAVVAIEAVAKVYARAGFGPRMAGYLALASDVQGALRDRCRSLGVPSEDVAGAVWRRALGCRTDKAIARVIPARIAGWPARSTKDKRDAAGAALFVGLGRKMRRVA